MPRKYTVIFFSLLSLGALILTVLFLMDSDLVMLNPKGLIGLRERRLILITTLLMLIVVIPVFILTFVIAWKYRASNKKATYRPEFSHSPIAEALWWGIPCAIILVIGVITWKSCYELDPFKPLDTPTKPITIQVVALDWKWLFIYPEYKIATVNFFQFPVDTAISFEITADAPMNSFWIPQLGGQVFAMPGMRTKLHLIANEALEFRGSSANISGKGFSGMTFTAKSSSWADFEQWVQGVQQSSQHLDLESYIHLAEPSAYQPAAFYALSKEDLFNWIVMKYMMPMEP